MREIFTKNNITVIFYPSYSPGMVPCDFSVSHHVNKIEAVLNTLTEHGRGLL
jgi:hypothetical protein